MINNIIFIMMAISGMVVIVSCIYNGMVLTFGEKIKASSLIIFFISTIFMIGTMIYICINYKDTRQEDCLSAGGIYSDIPGKRGCIYGK